MPVSRVRRVVDMLHELWGHVYGTGHREVLSTRDPVSGRVSICCADCDFIDEQNDSNRDHTFEVYIEASDLVLDDPLFGQGDTQRKLARWLQTIKSPVDQLQEPTKNDWDLLLRRANYE